MTNINEAAEMQEEAVNEANVEGLQDDSASLERILTFTTDNLTFGISTEQVIEIITNYPIRALPRVPDYVRGVINLRGQIVPIIDMRLRLNKEFLEYTPMTCIVILNIDSTVIGLAVDSVSQVMTINMQNTLPIPHENNQNLATSMVSMGDGKVVLLLDGVALISA